MAAFLTLALETLFLSGSGVMKAIISARAAAPGL